MEDSSGKVEEPSMKVEDSRKKLEEPNMKVEDSRKKLEEPGMKVEELSGKTEDSSGKVQVFTKLYLNLPTCFFCLVSSTFLLESSYLNPPPFFPILARS